MTVLEPPGFLSTERLSFFFFKFCFQNQAQNCFTDNILQHILATLTHYRGSFKEF